jgi:hypothetical protein
VRPLGSGATQCRCGGARKEILTHFPLAEARMDGLPRAGEIRDFVIRQIEHVELA